LEIAMNPLDPIFDIASENAVVRPAATPRKPNLSRRDFIAASAVAAAGATLAGGALRRGGATKGP
jgi:hypothetical protein